MIDDILNGWNREIRQMQREFRAEARAFGKSVQEAGNGLRDAIVGAASGMATQLLFTVLGMAIGVIGGSSNPLYFDFYLVAAAVPIAGFVDTLDSEIRSGGVYTVFFIIGSFIAVGLGFGGFWETILDIIAIVGYWYLISTH